MTTASYQSFFHYFGLRENPFHVSPDPRFYHSTPAHDSATQELLFGLQTRQGLLVLSGEAGTGKTTLLNSILDSLAQRHTSTAYVFHPLLEPVELFEFILRDFGVKFTANRKGDLIRILHEWLISRDSAGDHPVLVMDEAQSLSLQTLDELRLLLNLETPRGKLLQIILAGQSELEEKLRRPELRQLRQRVMFHCKLPTFSAEQTAGYVRFRMARAGRATEGLFPEETLQRVHLHAKGIPRVINLLCEHALITAYGEQQHIISAESIQRIAADFDLAARPIFVDAENLGPTPDRRNSFPLVDSGPLPATRIPAAYVAESKSAAYARFVALNTLAIPEEPAALVPPMAATNVAGPSLVATSIADQDPSLKDEVNHRPTATANGAALPIITKPLPEGQRPFWTEPRSRPLLPRFLRRPAVSLLSYCREVGASFARDCRAFFQQFRSAPKKRPIPAAQPGSNNLSSTTS
jgi:general secretion pathway protein A